MYIKLVGDELEECGRLEKEIREAQRQISIAKSNLIKAQEKYKRYIAENIGARIQSIELTTTTPCTKHTTHCVYDLRDSQWPRCVFCGSPKYGDY